MIGVCHDWHDSAVDPAIVTRLTRSLAVGVSSAVGHHRSGGSVFASHCAGHARGWRPALAPCGALLVFSGHIDNADTLRRQLESVSHDAATLYAEGYSRWGDAVDRRAIGQFATIAVLSGGSCVRLSRSPLQAPPLHYRNDGGCAIIASAARILFAAGDASPEIDEQKIADSLYLNYGSGEQGWFRNVRRVETGTHVFLTRGGSTARRYYDVADLPRIRLKRDADYVEAATALLAEGTRAALNGFSRPAISLSGGLDSQAVAASAIAALPPGQPVLGVTGVPESGWDGVDHPSAFGDERAHVAALAAMYPTLDVETVDAAGLSFDHKLAAMFLMGGIAPRNAMNLHWVHAVRARAKARGCDVLLLGAMGNWSFSFDGAGALPGWLAHGRWGKLRRELIAVQGDRSFARILAAKALLPFAPDPLYRRWAQWRDVAPPDPLPGWCPLDPAYARDMHVAERALGMGIDPAFRAPKSSRVWRAAAFGNAMGESGDVRQALDLIHDIPSRDPTAYRPLVEFCLGIPDDQYLRDGQQRFLARRMLRGKIPDLVVDETRRGRQAADWALRIDRDRASLNAELEALERDPAMARRLDLPRLRAALASWRPGTSEDAALRATIEHALPRAIATARFIRFVEGSNDG